MVHRVADEGVACAYGEVRGEDGTPLRAPVRQDAAMLERNPYWGYSNAAGGFRAGLWRERPFREDMPGTEDREWSRWALSRGMVCVLDPALAVEHDHSREPLRACFRALRARASRVRHVPRAPPYRARDALAEWWGDQGWHRSRARARLDPRRMARLAGKWWGRRA